MYMADSCFSAYMGGELRFDMYQPEQITSAETAEQSKSLRTWINMKLQTQIKNFEEDLRLKDLQTRKITFVLNY